MASSPTLGSKGTLLHCSTFFTIRPYGEESFLYMQSEPSMFQLMLVVSYLPTTHSCEKPGKSPRQYPCRHWESALRSPCPALSASSYRASALGLIILVVSAELDQVYWFLYCIGRVREGLQLSRIFQLWAESSKRKYHFSSSTHSAPVRAHCWLMLMLSSLFIRIPRASSVEPFPKWAGLRQNQGLPGMLLGWIAIWKKLGQACGMGKQGPHEIQRKILHLSWGSPQY